MSHRLQDAVVASGAELVDLSGCTGKRSHLLARPVVCIGRDPSANDVVLPFDTVSARHAEIHFRDGFYFLRDLKSTNGTFVDGRKISDLWEVREIRLEGGERIRFDTYEFQFRSGAGDMLKTQPPTAPARGVGPADPGSRAAQKRPAYPAREQETMLQPERCIRHKGFRATEFCQACKRAFCKYCVKQVKGRLLCGECAKA